MQWDPSPKAGFTGESIDPWLPIASNHTEVNVEKQIKDEGSRLRYYQRLALFRKEHEEIRYDKVTFMDSPEEVLVFKRGEKFLVIINFSETKFSFDLDTDYEISLVHKSEDATMENSVITVKGQKAVVLQRKF